jgi:hypothetical protein
MGNAGFLDEDLPVWGTDSTVNKSSRKIPKSPHQQFDLWLWGGYGFFGCSFLGTSRVRFSQRARQHIRYRHHRVKALSSPPSNTKPVTCSLKFHAVSSQIQTGNPADVRPDGAMPQRVTFNLGA